MNDMSDSSLFLTDTGCVDNVEMGHSRVHASQFCQAFKICCSRSATFWGARIWRPTCPKHVVLVKDLVTLKAKEDYKRHKSSPEMFMRERESFDQDIFYYLRTRLHAYRSRHVTEIQNHCYKS
ncbi:hypothetical protein TNCV_2775181 [Trichonephila clavipes]|nr:hypothetical protein TNCV_2775181 [Trichonephila clavipes]